MQGIQSIAHAAIRTPDIDRSLAFYVGQLGFPEMLRLHHPDGRLMLIYLRITPTQFLELFPEGEGGRAPGRMATGLNHICLVVDSIAAMLPRLEAAGIPLTQGPQVGLDRNPQAWIEDPDGNRIELMEMVPNSLQAEALARLGD